MRSLALAVTALAVFTHTSEAAASIIDTSGVVRSGDFDGDSIPELAVSSPETDCGKGGVYVVTATGNLTVWTRDTTGVLGTAACDDLFGASLAVGDFDGDGYDDLAIAAPNADDTSNAASGSIHVLYGSETGLTDTGDQLWTLDSPGVDGVAAADDHWGDALVAGDFNCDGYDDLAIGAPRKQGLYDLVSVLYGTSGGITSVGDQLLSRVGSFGAALAVGNFDGDEDNDIGCDDLVVGAPLSSGSGASNGGVFYVHPGGASGIDTEPTETIHQGVTGVVDDPEADDFFAWRLARARLNDDAYDDLLVAVPGDACTGNVGIGLHRFYGSSTGITVTDNAIACDTFGCSVHGDSTLACHSGSASVFGTAADEVIGLGMFGTQVAWGGSGADTIQGGFGDDVVFGGPGADFISGGPGRDVIIGGLGDDTMVIDLDCMVMEGEVVDGGPGSDTIRSHLSQYQLEGLGLTIVSVENFVLIDENPRGSGLCTGWGFDDGPLQRPPVLLSWANLTAPDAVFPTTSGILTLQLANTSADEVDVDLDLVLRVRGEELSLAIGPEAIVAHTADTIAVDLHDFIPMGVSTTGIDPDLLVLPSSASISTRAKLTVDSVPFGYSIAPTIFGHLEGSTPTAVLYREGAMHDTYHHGDLVSWRASATPYNGPGVFMGRTEAHGAYGIPGY